MATMNEDYDAAKIIKMEIEKLKQASYNPWLESIISSMIGGGMPKGSMMRKTSNDYQMGP